jgi:hypothetical protein
MFRILSFVLFFILCESQLIEAQNKLLSFSEPIDISRGTIEGISALDAADFNKDGLADIAVMEGGAHSNGRFTLAWFEQTKSGHWLRHDFNLPVEFDDFIGSARCGDVDNDGDMDLIFSNDGHSTGPIQIYFLENPGKRKILKTWKHHSISTIQGFHANDMRLEDIDVDGKLDVIVRHKNPESVKIVFQNTKNNWELKTVYTGQAGEGLATGDINDDGLPDITMTGHWFKTPHLPRLGEYKRFDIEAGYKEVNKATKEEVGDINGDGKPDVVLSPAEHFKKYGGENYDLAWYQCPENPEEISEWEKHIVESDYNKAHCAKLADFDNDGDLDILSAIAWDNRGIRIYLNNNGNFENRVIVTEGKGIYSGAVMDLDGDGDLDLIGEDRYSNNSRPWVYLNLLIE